MTAPRVGIVCDFIEEGWPSMDLVADRLASSLRETGRIEPIVLRAPYRRRLTRLSGRLLPRAGILDRLLNRHVDYPRWITRQPPLDLYHVVDHSYAHLVHHLPPGRTVVTCHDLDAFRSLLRPEDEPRSWAFRRLAHRTMSGLAKAARVICDTAAVRDELIAARLCEPQRLRVAPLGVEAPFSTAPAADADRAATALVGWEQSERREILHVGSTIPRKRLDVVLRILSHVIRVYPDAVLVRPGGLTEAQRRMAGELGVAAHVLELPFIDREILAALYRRAAVVVQPSDREGFGLPLLEALACGAPVVASDLPVLRETGGGAAVLCPPGDAGAFARAVLELLEHPDHSRRAEGVRHASQFTWTKHAAAVESVYRELAN